MSEDFLTDCSTCEWLGFCESFIIAGKKQDIEIVICRKNIGQSHSEKTPSLFIETK